jgi:hypothetical protein
MRPLRLVSPFTSLLITSLLCTILLAQSIPVSPITQPIAQPIAAKSAIPSGLSQPNAASQAKIDEKYGKLPLSFEVNQGQTDSRVKFLSRTGSYSLFLTGDEAVLELSGKTNRGKTNIDKAKLDKTKVASAAHALQSGMAETKAGGVLRMKLRNANGTAKVTGMDELAGTSNYFIGNDSAKWQTNVPTYAKVKYEGIYSGIDLVYYGNQRQLEYDFIVAPGADPHRIAFDVSGAQRIRQNAQGDLLFKMKMGDDEIRWHKPVVYQEKNGARQEIAARYSITATNRVGFELAKYDASKPLYIDPLIYSTYMGGTGGTFGQSIAVDSAGNAYITGFTGANFPTMNPLQPTYGGAPFDAFVAKINSEGSALVYATYLGGSNDDAGFGIAVDSSGNAYITGQTFSADFPTTPGAFQAACGGGNCSGDAFVTKINPSGSALVYSTYLGGSNPDGANAIAVDSSGSAYVTGSTLSTDFPIKDALQGVGGGDKAFVSKFNTAGTALVYSTYLGGSDVDYGDGITVDGAGNAYVTGETYSHDFPTTPGAFQTVCNGGSNCNLVGDAYLSKFDTKGSAFVYSTFLGGSSQDYGTAVAVDSAGDAYVTGVTASPDFPTKNPVQPDSGGGYDAFVTEFNPAGSALIYSTYLGGNGTDYGYGIAVDSLGNAYVVGETQSTNFPTINSVQPASGGNFDAFVTKLSPSGLALLYSTYLGGSFIDYGYGIAVDGTDSAYVTGYTYSVNFPTINPLEPQDVGSAAAFVAKITADLALTPQSVNFGNQFMSTSAVLVSKLTNTGSATLTISSITVTGANGGDFVESNNCGNSVPVGGSCNITVTFTPSALGTRTGDVIINDSALDSPHTIGLTGVGTSATTTSLTSTPNPSAQGQSVTLTAVIVPTQNGTPTGTVTFYNGATALGTVAISLDKAVLKYAKLSVGSHSLTAAYSGDAIFQPSTSPVVTQLVGIRTTTTLVSSLNPSTDGQAVTFTATVTSKSGAPPNGETVIFRKGSKVLGTGTLSGGSASFTTSTLPVGTDVITVVYGGDSEFLGSTSKAVKQVVDKAAD